MRMTVFRYARMVQYRDRSLLTLAITLVTILTLLSALISRTIASSYQGETIERVSYSYLYAFSGRTGYLLPLILSAYLVTASLSSCQSVRLYLLSSSKKIAFSAILLSSILFAGTVGTFSVIINHLISASILTLSNHPAELFISAQIIPLIRMVILHWCWAVFGAGLGFIINNIAILTSVVLAFSLFVEPTLSAASNRSQSLMSLTKWLPGPLNWASSWDGGAGSKIIRTAIGLPGNSALAVMCIYSIIIGVIGYYIFVHRSLIKKS